MTSRLCIHLQKKKNEGKKNTETIDCTFSFFIQRGKSSISSGIVLRAQMAYHLTCSVSNSYAIFPHKHTMPREPKTEVRII